MEEFYVENIQYKYRTEGDVWILTEKTQSLFVNGVYASSHVTGYGAEVLTKILKPMYKILGN